MCDTIFLAYYVKEDFSVMGLTERERSKRSMGKKTIITNVLSIQDYAEQELESYALPEVCNRVRSMLDSDDASLDELARVIVFDPSITAAVMKLANSAIYNFKNKVDSLTRAVTVLGGERIYSMLMTQFTNTTFHELHSRHLDMKRFWSSSYCTAFVAQDLAKMEGLNVKDQERLYICGLMHNLGELAVAKLSPKSAMLCEKLVLEGVHPWEAQRKQLGFTYVDCSLQMLRSWDLPESLIAPMESMACIQPPENNIHARILNIAANCALAMVSGELYSIDEFLNIHFTEFEEKKVEAIKSAKRNGADRSMTCILDLMDNFQAGIYLE